MPIYKLRYGILKSKNIFNECGPYSGGKPGWDEDSIKSREVVALRKINGLNKQSNFYNNLEKSILKEGFKIGTHFAHHLGESLEFGGSWVFRIRWEKKPLNWQFLNKEHIPPERIERLTQYRPIVRIGTQPHLTRKLDNEQESKNLTGISLPTNKQDNETNYTR